MDRPVEEQPMGFSKPISNPSLRVLENVEKLTIKQVFHLIEITGWEKNNVYQIFDENEQHILTCKEDTTCCKRTWMGILRPFGLHIVTPNNEEIISLNRPYRCQGCLCCCCLQEMTIQSPPGQVMGEVKELWTMTSPKWNISNAQGDVIYQVVGDCCYCKCSSVSYRVFQPSSGEEVGLISKRYTGCCDYCTQTSSYEITFPPGESVENKAILLGTAFLIDFMYFEYKGDGGGG